MSTLEIEEIAKQILFDEGMLKNKDLYKELIKEVDAYVGKALSRSGRRNNENFLKKLEDANAMDEEWVFDCFGKIFSHNVCRNWKPVYVVSQYRGLRFNDAKETSKFTPSASEQHDAYNTFLKNYEEVQGDGRHTLNSLLSDFAEAENISEQIFVCCQFAEKTELKKNDNKCISLNLSNKICKILLGSDDKIINEINILDNDEKKENIKEKLFNKRNVALHCAIADSNDEFTDLKIFLHALTDMLLKKTDGHESKEKSIWLEFLQVLQGVCLWLKKFDASLIVLVSRESDNTTGSDCVGEFFVFGENGTGISTFCQKVFPLVDRIQRYYFKTVLQQIPVSGSDAYKSLGFALQNTYDPKKITGLLKKTVFNFNSLAGVIRLAEVIRPFAVHEGKQQTIFFVVGYPYLRKDKLESISEFSGDNTIRWEIPGDNLKRPAENEALHIARTRIMGSSQTLQNPGVALFVDCNEDVPTCNHIVKPSPRGTIGFNANIVDIMANVTDAFIVRIIGQKKIEIFHTRKKILVWSHINATWEEESTWDIDSLKKVISEKLSVDSSNNDAIRMIRIVAEAAYQISQTIGQGASFVICKDGLLNKELLCPKMTIPFPELGEGEIKKIDSKKLIDVAIEDGGTLIDLAANKFYGRRQWLPYRDNEPPFWYENFTIPENEWSTFYNTTWTCKDNPETPLKTEATSPKLYEMCKSKFLEKTSDGKESFCKNPWYWEEWYKILSWGTRHISSMGMSACLWDTAIVVVVSADNTITVFYQGIEQKSKNE